MNMGMIWCTFHLDGQAASLKILRIRIASGTLIVWAIVFRNTALKPSGPVAWLRRKAFRNFLVAPALIGNRSDITGTIYAN